MIGRKSSGGTSGAPARPHRCARHGEEDGGGELSGRGISSGIGRGAEKTWRRRVKGVSINVWSRPTPPEEEAQLVKEMEMWVVSTFEIYLQANIYAVEIELLQI